MGDMPTLPRKALKALQGFNHRINSAQKRNNLLAVSEKKNFVQIKTQGWSKHPTFSISVLCERSCCLCSWRVRRGERAAAWRLSSSNTEAPTWGRKQRAPRGGPRGDVLHDSLTVFSPPPVHPCVGPPPLTAAGERSVTFKFIPCSSVLPSKERENLILFFLK